MRPRRLQGRLHCLRKYSSYSRCFTYPSFLNKPSWLLASIVCPPSAISTHFTVCSHGSEWPSLVTIDLRADTMSEANLFAQLNVLLILQAFWWRKGLDHENLLQFTTVTTCKPVWLPLSGWNQRNGMMHIWDCYCAEANWYACRQWSLISLMCFRAVCRCQ